MLIFLLGVDTEDSSQSSHVIHHQIRRSLILHKELDADDGELTRTLKVRRNFVADRYDSLINALYSDKTECHVCTEVIFEDGRSGMLEADVKISEAEFYPVKSITREAAA